MYTEKFKDIKQVKKVVISRLIIELEDLNQILIDFDRKDSSIAMKELKAKGILIKAIIGELKKQIEEGIESKNYKNIEYIDEKNIDEIVMECILYGNSQKVEEIVHNMCYILREIINKDKEMWISDEDIYKLSTDM